MPNDEVYDAAASAVHAGTADKKQHALNAKMANNSRTFSRRAGAAQDAKKHHESEVQKGRRKDPTH